MQAIMPKENLIYVQLPIQTQGLSVLGQKGMAELKLQLSWYSACLACTGPLGSIPALGVESVSGDEVEKVTGGSGGPAGGGSHSVGKRCLKGLWGELS